MNPTAMSAPTTGTAMAPAADLTHRHGTLRSAEVDAVIEALAARQHGIVTRSQLTRAGVPRHRIEYRVARRHLQRRYRGVYRVGAEDKLYGPEMAAAFACGESALVSHRSAAVAWQLHPHPAIAMPVEVSIRHGYRVPGRGVRVYRITGLCEDEAARLHGIPITSPARTLLDLASCVGERELERALAHAERQCLVRREHIELLLARYPRRSGTVKLRGLLAFSASAALTRSEAEARFLELIRKAQLRAPETNVVVKGCEVDFLWRAERLVAEIDGYAFHCSPAAFERDRRRDAVLTAAGMRVMRITWRQLSCEPEALLVRLAQALGRPTFA
jgi:very-short-patch-repair endonuclease